MKSLESAAMNTAAEGRLNGDRVSDDVGSDLDLVNPIGTTVSAQHFLEQELQNSHGAYHRWGRQVIEAISIDNCLRMKEIFVQYKSLGADVNTQVDQYGYGGYTWTIWNHQFYGDTILHICIKQKKVHCMCQLLLMQDIRLDIVNHENENANQLCYRIFEQSIYSVQSVARSALVQLIDPRNFHRLPVDLKYLSMKEEAWSLMESGRCLYTEVPASLIGEFDWADRPNPWELKNTKYKGPYMRHKVTEKLRKLTPREEHSYNSKWRESREGSGWRQYINEVGD
jgi:hypothetical protein